MVVSFARERLPACIQEEDRRVLQVLGNSEVFSINGIYFGGLHQGCIKNYPDYDDNFAVFLFYIALQMWYCASTMAGRNFLGALMLAEIMAKCGHVWPNVVAGRMYACAL